MNSEVSDLTSNLTSNDSEIDDDMEADNGPCKDVKMPGLDAGYTENAGALTNTLEKRVRFILLPINTHGQQDAALELMKVDGKLKNRKKLAGTRRNEQSSAPVEVPRAISEGRDADHPINVDSWDAYDMITWSLREVEASPDLTTSGVAVPKKLESAQPRTFYGPHGEAYDLLLCLHFGRELALVEFFFDKIEANYVDGGLKHMKQPQESVLEVMTFETYRAKSSWDILEILCHKDAITVTEMPFEKVSFDKKGLQTLQQSFKNTISIQGAPIESLKRPIDLVASDYSIEVQDVPNIHLQNGTLEQLLEVSQDQEGKVLNALDFLFAQSLWLLCEVFSSDMAAWFATDRPLDKTPIPVKDIRWGLAVLAWALTYWHIDSDGFNTFIDVLCSSKLWIFGVSSRDMSAMIERFLQPDFKLEQPNAGDLDGPLPKCLANLEIGNRIWDLEAVLLPPNTRLIMRANVAHAVFTPEHSICHGRHFYATSTMQDTVASLIHSFVIGTYITNMSHTPSRLLLRRMMEFYHWAIVRGEVFNDAFCLQEHIPDVDTIEGLVDLLCVCNLNILGNVLDHRTYSAPNETKDQPASLVQRLLQEMWDMNNIPPNERKHMCYARGRALDVFCWICAYLTVTLSSQAVDLPALFLAHQSHSILNYKAQAVMQAYSGAPRCNVANLREQIKNALQLDTKAFEMWQSNMILSKIETDSLLLGDLSRFTILRPIGVLDGLLGIHYLLICNC
ncbi:unnamed protein product [Cyclocybe aegerita]|uniref:Uncharacterized protein n=1 Tax=Cyclocybe aegerita TaxID=1973307 RepID=A0A8S0WI66_CYCAE|nr:unnamed protein product [Cyclocybe aegerita]